MTVLERVFELRFLGKGSNNGNMDDGYNAGRNSDKFDVKVVWHNESVLSPLLFVIVMEIITNNVAEEYSCGNYCMQMV